MTTIHHLSPELIEETYGFRPTVMISLQQAKYAEPARSDEGHINMIHAVDWIVNHLNGDLVFLVRAGKSPPSCDATVTCGSTTGNISGCRRTSSA
jgi:hypothetical protein